MYTYLEDILHDCRGLPEMCRALPIAELRQMVHDYHYSELLLENEIYGVGGTQKRVSNVNLYAYLRGTQDLNLVTWRDNRVAIVKSNTGPWRPAHYDLDAVIGCQRPCKCLRVICYYQSDHGCNCICGWPIPVN